MASSFEKYQKRRLISSYFSVVISISLVLFLLGLLGLLVLNGKKVGDHFKEQIPISIYLKDNAKEVEITQLKQSLALAEYTKSATFVSKEEAAEKHTAEIGENYMEFLGYNPLQNSIDVRMIADYVTPEKIEEIVAEISTKSFVDEVVYDKPLIQKLYDNLKKISLWVLIISGVFTFIAVLLINSSIRLSVYAKRFTIKTMQMVGATRHFIARPFNQRAILNGAISGIIASLGLFIFRSAAINYLPELQILNTDKELLFLCLGIILVGILISYISTHRSVVKYLKMQLDDLY